MFHRIYSYRLLIAVLLCVGLWPRHIQAQIFYNNGAQVTVKEDALVGILGTLLNDDGNFDNGGYVWIDGNCENNDMMSGTDGALPVASSTYVVRRDWINNSLFNAAQGTVELDSSILQQISGSTPTTFNILDLKGSQLYNVKQQTVNTLIGPNGQLRVNDAELATDLFNMIVTNTATTSITHNQGFISSLDGAYTSWAMNSAGVYEYPVGSSLGTLRKRVARLTPGSAAANTMGVRFANVDATTEGYDRDSREQEICEINPFFYHRLYRLSGVDNMDIDLQYVVAADGNWDYMVNWENSPAREWSLTEGSFAGGGFVSVDDWTAFADTSFAYARQLSGELTAVPTSICPGESANLILTNLSPGATLSWNQPGLPAVYTGPIPVSPATTTTYIVTISANGCNKEDTATIVVEPQVNLSISISADPFSCDNSPVIFTADTSGGGITGVINWYVNGAVQPGQNGSTFVLTNPNNGDVVRAEYTTLAGCSGSASSEPIVVSTGDALTVSLIGGGLDCVPEGETVALFATVNSPSGGDISITWQSNAELSCLSGCNTNYVTPGVGDTTWVTVTATDINTGCYATDSVQVCAVDVPALYIPSAFTPDDDTDNDVLFILGDLDRFSLIDFRVYNRWGELLWSTSTFDQGWDGTYKGVEQEMDVYVYYASATFLDTGEQTELKGCVALLK